MNSLICRFSETKPLISFNKSIDFVQRFHWFRSTIPLILFRQTAVFPSSIRQFHRFRLAVSRGSICAMGKSVWLFCAGFSYF
jgi:hypothetical protein